MDTQPPSCPTPPKHFIPTQFAYHETLELDIQTLTNEGRGIGRHNDWAVMVPFVIPGERVRVRIFRNHKNYSEADLVEVLTPSPQRIQPCCPLFGRCGGCQYQHITYEEQLRWKRQHVADCLERIGNIHTEVRSVVPSEKIYGYRTKLTPHFERFRGQCPVGFLANGSRHTIVDVPQCPIASDAVNEALPKVRERIVSGSARNGTALLRDCDDGVLTDFNASGTAHVHGLTFHFPAGSFFQNNPYILETLLSHLEAFFKEHPELEFLADTYCGTGVFGISLASVVKQFVGIEIDEKSVALAQTNLRCNHITNGSVVHGNSSELFKEITFDPQKTCVLLDPPRKGTDEAFLQQLARFAPRAVIYVSCAPDTQARDLQRFLEFAPYKVTCVQPFDMFPQTKHVETVAFLVQEDV